MYAPNPFLLKDDPEDRLTLWTHIARSNPQWKDFEANPIRIVNYYGTWDSPNKIFEPQLLGKDTK